MEIEEFLTRIDLKGADSTIFKKEKKEITFLKNGTEEKKEVDGISTFTKTDNGSSAVSGFLIYNKKFPKKVFSMQPSILKKILSETDDIDITDKMNIDGEEVDGTFLVGLSKEGNIYEDIEPLSVLVKVLIPSTSFFSSIPFFKIVICFVPFLKIVLSAPFKSILVRNSSISIIKQYRKSI